MSAGGTNGAGSGSGEGVGRVKPSVGSKCAFIIALILVGAARGGRAGARGIRAYGSSSAPKSSHTSQHHRLHEMGSSPHRSHEYWSSLFPGKMAGSNMTSYSRTCVTLLRAEPRASASARLGPFPSRESFPVGSSPSLDSATRAPVTSAKPWRRGAQCPTFSAPSSFRLCENASRDFRLPFSWRTATFRPESSLQPRACRHGGGGFVARCGCIRAHRGVTARHATQRAIRVRGGPRRREALRGDRAFRRVAQRQTCEPHPRVPRPHVENTRGGDGVSERGARTSPSPTRLPCSSRPASRPLCPVGPRIGRRRCDGFENHWAGDNPCASPG